MQYIKSRMLDRELKKGSAELLILSLVEDQPRHGYDLSKLIELRSGGVLKFRVASLYPLLYRLEKRGWIQGRWVEKAGQRRRRYYRLTPAGRKQLAAQTGREAVERLNQRGEHGSPGGRERIGAGGEVEAGVARRGIYGSDQGRAQISHWASLGLHGADQRKRLSFEVAVRHPPQRSVAHDRCGGVERRVRREPP